MSSRAWIGITTYHRGRSGFVKLPGEYADAVRRAGALPVLLQPGEQHLSDVLEGLDGLVISGGGDVGPHHYREEPVPEEVPIYGVNEERDTSEIRLLRLAIERRVRTLCICRGLQVLNVALGGTLYPHIPDAIPAAISHRTDSGDPILHSVAIDRDSSLSRVIGKSECSGSSWHHQAVDSLGESLCVTARAADGVIEALEIEDNDELLAVQWHPELTAERDPTQQRLFDWLVRR